MEVLATSTYRAGSTACRCSCSWIVDVFTIVQIGVIVAVDDLIIQLKVAIREGAHLSVAGCDALIAVLCVARVKVTRCATQEDVTYTDESTRWCAVVRNTEWLID